MASKPTLRVLFGGSLGLGGGLLVAPDHDDAEEGADDGGSEEDEDDGDADGPLARGEEVLEGVVVVDKGLCARTRSAGTPYIVSAFRSG
jgi:hypothetical protein